MLAGILFRIDLGNFLVLQVALYVQASLAACRLSYFMDHAAIWNFLNRRVI